MRAQQPLREIVFGVTALVFIPQERSFGIHTQVGELARDVRGVRARAVADLYHYDSNILLREPAYESDHPIAGDAAGNGFLDRYESGCWIRHDVAFSLLAPHRHRSALFLRTDLESELLPCLLNVHRREP